MYDYSLQFEAFILGSLLLISKYLSAYAEVRIMPKVVMLLEKALLAIILIRLISGSVELTAASLMYKFNDLEKALYINSMLALVGPVVLITTTGIGLTGLADRISWTRLICLFGGIFLILVSLRIK
ncbi:YqhV family protein [Chungangia koreensis]|uniref:YqhV family protein n=1 Tax=Chungangia koreensis TaxID=752657 RepID=A0ABV8X7R8_9LACT